MVPAEGECGASLRLACRLPQYALGFGAVLHRGLQSDGADWLKRPGNGARASEEGYDANREAHREWWAGYWDKSAVRLPDPLYEKKLVSVNYLFGACSRKGCPPMPLQGVWTADNGEMPPWKEITTTTSTRRCPYYHYLKANHLPEGESFLDYLWSLQPTRALLQRAFYGAAGACLPSVMAIDGTALSGWPMYSLPTNRLWLSAL